MAAEKAMNICHYKCLRQKTEACCTKTKTTTLTQPSVSVTEVELLEMQPGGYSPLHSHRAQHTILVLQGEGAVFGGEKTFPIQADEVVTITQNEQHQIRNIGKTALKLLLVTSQSKQ
ncbi:MAG: cupin domain-containing protein [Candidatus Bathyarchaeota archaeon]|nr:cupin domain-containing protein [Candidatus Bathyarchaeota archaeon]